MPIVTALYRYPVKGFTPESRARLTVLPSGWVQGDRAFVFRFADASVSPLTPGDGAGEGRPSANQWLPKTNYAVLMNVPDLARAALHYDDARQRLRIAFPDGHVADAALDDAGRARLEEAVARYMAAQTDSPLHGHPEKLPLTLVGGGDGQHFHDGAPGRVSLHSRASLRALTTTTDDPDLDERRFRSNIVIEGVDEWEEFHWVGKRLRIGPRTPSFRASRSDEESGAGRPRIPPPSSEENRPALSGVTFEVVKTTVRCLATHANPVTGERDCDIMNTLTRTFGHEKPQFGVTMLPENGGDVHVGDEVTLL